MAKETKDRVYHIFSDRVVPIFSLLVAILSVVNLWTYMGLAERKVKKELREAFPRSRWELQVETYGPTILYLATEKSSDEYEVGVYEKTSWPYLVYRKIWSSQEESVAEEDITMYDLTWAKAYVSFNSSKISHIVIREEEGENAYDINEEKPFIVLTDKADGVTFYDVEGRIYSPELK